MAKTKVEFKLAMPGVASADGKWSGQDKNYTITKELTKDQVAKLGDKKYWAYSFGDGWVAGIKARVLNKDTQQKESDGFCGYDWMVESILKTGMIKANVGKDKTKVSDEEKEK